MFTTLKLHAFSKYSYAQATNFGKQIPIAIQYGSLIRLTYTPQSQTTFPNRNTK